MGHATEADLVVHPLALRLCRMSVLQLLVLKEEEL